MIQNDTIIEESSGNIIVKTPKGNKLAREGGKFVDEIICIAKDSGLRNFRVFVEGIGEISRSNAPANVSHDMSIRLEPFDVAAMLVDEECPYKKQIEEDEMFDCPLCSNETCDYYVDHSLDD